ncbi:hypothetical protein [Actinomadura craniellae]|nr:hypothetical protein [Actinomadura craniellae]
MDAQASEHGRTYQAARDQTIHDYGGVTYNYGDASGQAAFRVRPLSARDLNPEFIGRQAETDHLLHMLDPDSAVTGPVQLSARRPGTGMTALAVQVAATAARRGWYRVVYVGLPAPHGNTDRVRAERLLPVLLDALGRPPASGSPHDLQIRYRTELAELAEQGERVLLVVDDVTEADADLLETLAAGSPHRLLVTACPAVERVRGASTVPVGGLPEHEAVEFLDRALVRGSTNTAPRPHLQRLAWLCDGLPEALRRAVEYLTSPGRSPASVCDLVQELADEYDARAEPGSGPTADRDPSVHAIIRLAGHGWGLSPAVPGTAAGKHLVGRRALLGWTRADHEAGRAALWDIVARPGTGKSSLLQVMGETFAGPGTSVVFISAEWGALAYDRRRSSSDDPLVVELARAEFCYETVQRAADDLADAEPQQAALVNQIRVTRLEVESLLDEPPPHRPDLDVKDALLPHAPAVAAPPVLDERVSHWYADRVREKLQGFGTQIATLLAELTAADDRRLVVLADNLHRVTDPACRTWLLDILTRQVHCLAVISRRPGTAPAWPGAITYRPRNLTTPEISEYFRLYLGEGVMNDELCGRISRHTEGSPQAVALICSALLGRGERTLTDVLGDLRATAVGAPLIQRICLVARQMVTHRCELVLGRTEAELPLFDYLAVMNNIDAPLLATVLGKYGFGEAQAGELLGWLEEQHSFIGGYDDDEEEGLRLHEAVREQRRGELAPARLRELHLHLEAIYHARVEDFSPDFDEWEESTAYCAWSRFELPEYRRLLREWVYHAVRGQGASLDRRTALGITKVFLEAFWWWGCYVRFELCDELLRVFDEVVGDRTGADEERLAVLVRFYLNYPRGWQQDQADPERWDEVAGALRAIRHGAGLHRRPPRADDRTGHALNVLTLLFLAQAYRFRRPGGDPEKADDRYAQARESVRRHVAAGYSEHAWHEPWLIFERADMWCELGDLDRSAGLLRELDAIAEQDVDMEVIDRDLMCRAVRLHGDVRLARGDHRAAAEAYGRAVMLAYTYHVWQETEKQSANAYTRELHRETLARAGDGLALIHRRDPRRWAEGVEWIRAFFAPYRRAAGIEERPGLTPAGDLFPPPPAEADLEQPRSAYTERIETVIEELYDTLGKWTSLDSYGR